jgi:outer membrane protein assembly factor BamE (lipoprotein component of BamABCDE complex)
MNEKRWLSATGFALCCLAASTAYCADAGQAPGTAPDYSDPTLAQASAGQTPMAQVGQAPGSTRDLSDATLDRLILGQTTRAEVEALLGKPDIGKPDVWEYRSRESNIPYRVHLEFNAQGIVIAVAKVLDNIGTAPARAAGANPGTRDGTVALASPGQTATAQVPGSTPDYSGYNHDYSNATLAKVNAGKTTKAQVVKLLGAPWRTINYAEPGEDMPGDEQPEIWEWRGRDSQIGPYRVHIEFTADITSLIAKIPENTGTAWARVGPPSAQVSRAPGVIDKPSAGMFRYQAQAPVAPTKNGGD